MSLMDKNAIRPDPSDLGRMSHLSLTTSDCARCIANPFTGPVCGIPTYPTTMSFKQRSWVKGQFSTGTGGIGFIIGNPFQGSFNDIDAVVYSLSTYAGTTITELLGATVVSGKTNSQYLSTQLGSGTNKLQFRPVAAGLRIRYTGSELNRGGQIIALVDPTHDDMNGRSISDLDSEVTSVRFPVNREWVTVLHRAVTNAELQYQSAYQNSFYMGLMIAAASAATPLSYEFEFYVVTEFQGAPVRGQTPTPHDPTGYAALDYVTQMSPHLRPNTMSPHEREGSVVGQVAKYLAHGISHVTQHHSDHIKQIAHAASSSASGGTWYESLWNGIKSVAPVAMSLLPALL